MAIDDCYPDLWDDPVALANVRGLDDIDEVIAAMEEASWILWSLTGNRFSSNYQARTDLYRNRCIAKLKLAHGPVAKVFDVSYLDPADDTVTARTGWTYLRGGLLRLSHRAGGSNVIPLRSSSLGCRCRCGCDSDDRLLQVTYLTKPNLPAGGPRATRKLAYELYLANRGAPCALPDRITSVNRQGVSWTILDPMSFLNDKLTGLGSVDQWISAVNNRGYGHIKDPLTWLELVESEVIGCGEDFVYP